MAEHVSQITSGDCGPPIYQPYVPGINCCECGRFVGRDGSIEIETFEMSTVVASVDGTCAQCISGGAE